MCRAKGLEMDRLCSFPFWGLGTAGCILWGSAVRAFKGSWFPVGDMLNTIIFNPCWVLF